MAHENDNCHEQLSAKYTDYINTHLDQFKAKCKQINICVDKLLDDENVLTVIGGYDLRLNKTCSLVYNNRDDTNGTSGICTSAGRAQIRSVIEEHLADELDEKKAGWTKVRQCLDNNYGCNDQLDYVDKLCGLAYNKTQICKEAAAHKTVRDFFNDQIHHLKCTCKALDVDKTEDFPLLIVVLAIVGAVVLLALLVICIFCYIRHMSKKRQQKTPSVIYMQAPINENCPVYQEIFDDRSSSRYPGYKQSPSHNPPSLPMRYTTSSSNPSGLCQLAAQEDVHGYLEPAAASSRLRPQLPIPGNSNPNYGSPPEYSETEVTDEQNNYFEPLPSPTEEEDKIKMDTLGQKKSPGVTTNPIPAKRTQINQRPESPYFLLESELESKTEDVSV